MDCSRHLQASAAVGSEVTADAALKGPFQGLTLSDYSERVSGHRCRQMETYLH